MALGLPPVPYPISLQGTMSGEDILSQQERLAQEYQQMLMQNAQAAAGQAQQAQQQYQQAAAQPTPQLNPAETFVPTLLSNIASVIARDPKFRERAQVGMEQKQSDLLKARQENLLALRDVYSQKADEARRAGDLEGQEKYRSKIESLGRQAEAIDKKHQNAIALENLRHQNRLNEQDARTDEDPGLDPAGVDAAALFFARTGQLPPLGMGKAGAKMRAQIINRAAVMNPNLDLAGNQAAFRADRNSLSNIQRVYDAATAFEKTALKNAEVLKQTMAKIPDTGTPWLNQPIRTLTGRGLGGADLAAFNVARRVVIPEFARLLNSPTAGAQLTDTARKEIESVVRGDYSVNQMMAALDVLATDASNRRISYSNQLDEIKSRISPGGTKTPTETDTTTTSGGGGKVMVLSPKGKRFEIDAKDLPEAIKRGWKRTK